MSDSSPTRPIRAAEPSDDADREARIEQLLLTGLDHYFAGHYERAISVWTRVVFLERHHDRAKAYIERARVALAERHRKSEELLHHGLEAYNAGDVGQARDLLTRAVEQGSDAADVFLNRLDRVGVSPSPEDGGQGIPIPARPAARRQPLSAPRRRLVQAVLAAVVVGITMLVSGLPLGTWLSELEVSPVPAARPLPDEPLPIVRPADLALDRAQALHADGRLWDALRALDAIGLADLRRPEADRVRAAIQRDILSLAGVSPLVPAASGSQP
jgi:hypothetical protein